MSFLALNVTEDDVVNSVASFLENQGYAVDSMCNTRQQGIDIVAHNKRTGRRIRVEAKGSTSSKEGTARFGKPFSDGQIRHHVSRAFYEAVALLNEFPHDEVALALPNTQSHRKRIEHIRIGLSALGIKVFLVSSDRFVTVF